MCLVLGLVLGMTAARADDVTTLSGTTYRDVRAVRVDPDGVTWEHATGIVKVDFADLPEPVRKAYRYDAGKAKVFQEAQAKAQAEFAARAQQAQREAEAHRVQPLRAPATTAGQAAGRPGEFVFRRRAEEETAVKSLGGDIAAKQDAEAFRTKDDGTIWDRRLWAVPKFLFGSNPHDGVAFNPKTDLNRDEFKGGVHHPIGGFAPSSTEDSFFQPLYETRSYYEDVERAEAFARGKP